jgi:serine/threonine-protein kinase RsbT
MDERYESSTRFRTDHATTVRSGEVSIGSEDDILSARQQARTLAEDVGFSITDVTRIVTAVSELARNVHLYAGEGLMRWAELEASGRTGIELSFEDDGPGIDDVDGVLNGTHSTSDGMGRGIQGTKKLMDEFELATGAETGTTVTIRKWL